MTKIAIFCTNLQKKGFYWKDLYSLQQYFPELFHPRNIHWRLLSHFLSLDKIFTILFTVANCCWSVIKLQYYSTVPRENCIHIRIRINPPIKFQKSLMHINVHAKSVWKCEHFTYKHLWRNKTKTYKPIKNTQSYEKY